MSFRTWKSRKEADACISPSQINSTRPTIHAHISEGNDSNVLRSTSLSNRLNSEAAISCQNTPIGQQDFQPQQMNLRPPDLSSSPSCNCQPLPSSSHPFPSQYIRRYSPTSSSESIPSNDEENESETDDESNSEKDQDTLASSEKEVQIIDTNGNTMKKKQFKFKDVMMLPDDERVVVEVNGFHQPVGDARSALTRWMTLLMKQPSLCPPDAKDFKEVRRLYVPEILRNVRMKFLLPQKKEVDAVLTSLLSIKYRILRHKRANDIFKLMHSQLMKTLKETLEANGVHGEELKNQLQEHKFNSNEIDAQLEKLPTQSDFSDTQWVKFRSYLKSEEFKKLSDYGKKARAEKSHMHTTGTISFAEVNYKFEKKNKRKAGYVELFNLTPIREKMVHVKDISRDFANTAQATVAEHMASGSYNSQYEAERDTWIQYIGDDKPGRARCYGAGATKSKAQKDLNVNNQHTSSANESGGCD